MSRSPDIVLTGTSGWLGSRLLFALNEGLPDYPEIQVTAGTRLRCFYRTGEELGPAGHHAENQIENILGDLSNVDDCEKLVEGTEEPVILHTAGTIHPRRVKEFYANNLQSPLNLLRAAAQQGCKRMVVVSSNSPIGCNPFPEHRFTEESPYNPYQHYGRSKMRMEIEIRELADRLGIDVVIVRPPWFYGPFQPPRQTLFFSMIREGKVPLVGDGSNQRSMVYIDNLCHGIMQAASVNEAAGNIYWLADETPYEMRHVIDTIEGLLEKDFSYEVAHKRMRLPSVVGDIAYLIDRVVQGTGLYEQKIHVLSEMNKNIACSIEKAKQEIAYKPRISLKEGMRRSIQWCLDQGYAI